MIHQRGGLQPEEFDLNKLEAVHSGTHDQLDAPGVGIMCGGALYVPAFFACAVAIVYLRFAPRSGGAHHENLSPSHSADPIIAGSVDALPRRGLSIHS